MDENEEKPCTALVPYRRMDPFSSWRILHFLLRRLEQRRQRPPPEPDDIVDSRE